MYQGIETIQCDETYCEYENVTANKSIQETASEISHLSTLKQTLITDVIEKENDKATLPFANPYIAVYLILVVSAAVISNCVVLIVMVMSRKKLLTFQICLISVCVSDLLFSLLLHPMSIATAVGYNPQRIFNHSGCLYFGVLALMFGSYDMIIHSVIAVLRYINVCYPVKIQWFSKRTITVLITVCVVYSVIWSIGPIFGIGKYVTFEVGCTMAFADSTISGRAFVNCAFIFIFFIPLTVTIASYIAIVVETGNQRRNLEKIGSVYSVGTNRLAVELKLVRLTSVIAATYILVWLPYAIVCLADAYGESQHIPWIFRILSALFCKTGTATNPVMYLFMSRGFRRETIETMRVLFRKKKQTFSPSLLYSSSQKSSSCRSQSQVSLRSSRSNRIKKKEQSSLPRKGQNNPISNIDEESNRSETTV